MNILNFELVKCLASHNLPDPVINEGSVIGKLDYCFKVNEPSTYAKNNGICVRIYS